MSQYDVLFATSNKNKFLEAQKILQKFDISLGFYRCKIPEMQSDSLIKIAKQKLDYSFDRCKKPVLVEDDGLFINSLKGFPGPYSSYIYDTIGNEGILNLVKTDRTASFHSVIVYGDSNHTKTFCGIIHGKISQIAKGKGWGYDPIFIPTNQTKTFAELDKNQTSHRYLALDKFATWFR